MMYEDCISCKKCGDSCAGPNFMAMPTSEIVDWIDRFQHVHGITNAALAEMSNTPKGTIDGIKARKQADIRHETLRPILAALVGDFESENPCPSPDDGLAEEIAALKIENEKLKNELKFAKRLDVEREKTIERFDAGLKGRKPIIYGLMAICVLLGVSLLHYISMDISNPNFGLVRQSYISPIGIFIIAVVCVSIGVLSVFVYNMVKNRNKKDGTDE